MNNAISLTIVLFLEGPTHSGGTETKVKEIVSDIPPHTNQNIGIF